MMKQKHKRIAEMKLGAYEVKVMCRKMMNVKALVKVNDVEGDAEEKHKVKGSVDDDEVDKYVYCDCVCW